MNTTTVADVQTTVEREMIYSVITRARMMGRKTARTAGRENIATRVRRLQ